MGFEPMKFCVSDRTIPETHRSFPLELTPITLPVNPDQSRQNANPSARCDRLDLSDFAEDLVSHGTEDISAEILTD